MLYAESGEFCPSDFYGSVNPRRIRSRGAMASTISGGRPNGIFRAITSRSCTLPNPWFQDFTVSSTRIGSRGPRRVRAMGLHIFEPLGSMCRNCRGDARWCQIPRHSTRRFEVRAGSPSPRPASRIRGTICSQVRRVSVRRTRSAPGPLMLGNLRRQGRDDGFGFIQLASYCCVKVGGPWIGTLSDFNCFGDPTT